MGSLRRWENFFYEIINTKKPLNTSLKQVLAELKISIKELSRLSKIPKSTLYKIVSGERKDPLLSNTVRIVNTIREVEEGKNYSGNIIAVITIRSFLENLNRFKPKKKNLVLKGYPAADIGEGMIQGINAERDGVKAIICGPVTAFTLEKIVKIPVISLKIEELQMNRAIKSAIENIS